MLANSISTDDNFSCLLITFANSLDQYQARQNVGPDLDPNQLAAINPTIQCYTDWEARVFRQPLVEGSIFYIFTAPSLKTF